MLLTLETCPHSEKACGDVIVVERPPHVCLHMWRRGLQLKLAEGEGVSGHGFLEERRKL